MIHAGDWFNTVYDKQCRAITNPDKYGEFVGIDSDGVECSYHISMIQEIIK